MTNTEKRIKQQKIKETIKHIIHGVCYVLSVAFIILMVVVGAQSCSNSKNNIVTNNNNQPSVNNSLSLKKGLQPKLLNINDIDFNDYTYFSRKALTNPFEISENAQQRLCDYSVDFDHVYSSEQGYYDYSISFNGYLCLNSGELLKLDGITLRYYTFQDGVTPPTYFYRLYQIRYYIENDYWVFCEKNNGQIGNVDFNIVNNMKLLVENNDYVSNSYFFEFFYVSSSPTTFLFNKVYNYNAPWYTSLGSSYIQSGTTIMQPWVYNSGWAYKREDRLDIGYFISGGQVFNRIVIESKISISGDYAFLYDSASGKQYNAPENDWIFLNLYYENTDTSTRVLVNYRDLVTGYDSTFQLPWSAYGETTTWVNDDYRQLVILGYLDNDLITAINAFNNNNQTSISGNVIGADTSNVFTLVGSAFTALLPVLNTMLLPGITIGMLMFVPLVAMLVFAIIRIIKK